MITLLDVQVTKKKEIDIKSTGQTTHEDKDDTIRVKFLFVEHLGNVRQPIVHKDVVLHRGQTIESTQAMIEVALNKIAEMIVRLKENGFCHKHNTVNPCEKCKKKEKENDTRH